MSEHSFDALVVGAGAGGLFTAARLAQQGYRPLVVERLGQVGGRASSEVIDGFTINNGAIIIEVGSVTEETFTELGIPWEIRRPKPPILYRIGGKDVDVTGGGWGFLLSKMTRQGAKLLDGLGAARTDEGLPDAQISTHASYYVDELATMVLAGKLDYAQVGVCGDAIPPARLEARPSAPTCLRHAAV